MNRLAGLRHLLLTYFNRCFKKEYGMTPTEYILKTIRLKE
ncbi:helix-turn-helix transcriptional regulator [Butyrivibrio sp. INlla14]